MNERYTYVWEFFVDGEFRAEFERHYGADGTWVQLFRQAPGFIETLLLTDRARPERYVTVDRWESQAAYAEFGTAFGSEYADLDARFEKLTRAENLIGEFRE